MGEIDNRGSSFYLALYWAHALASQLKDMDMQPRFATIAGALEQNENDIVKELLEVQGQPVDLGGYFMPDEEKAAKVMRPSITLNGIIDSM